jgi:hypothetical protein
VREVITRASEPAHHRGQIEPQGLPPTCQGGM